MKAVGRLLRSVLGARGGFLAMVQTAIAQVLTMGVNVATGVITARLLGPTGRGEFAAAALWLLLPSLLATAGIQNAVIYCIRQRPDRAGAICATALIASTAAFLPMLLFCLWMQPALMHAYPESIVLLAQTALLLSIANVWMTILRQWLLAIRQFGAFNLLVYGIAFAYLATLIVMARLHAVTPASAVYAQIGSTILGLLLVAPTLAIGMRRTHVAEFTRHMRDLLRYGLRAAPIDVVSVLGGNIDRLFLIALIPAAEFGLYVVALSFARILSVLQTAISAVMLSDLADRPRTEVAAFTGTCFRLLLWLLVVGCGSALMVDSTLLRLVYGPGFTAAVPIFRIVLLDAALGCLAQVLIQAFLARNSAGIPSSIQVFCFAVSAAGVALLAPMFGGVGAAAALAVGSALRLVLLLVALDRIGIARPGLLPRRDDLEPVLRRLHRSAPAGIP